MMTTNTSSVFNKGIFVNVHPLFNDERFELWKTRMNFFEMWNFIINGLFIPSYYIDNKVVNNLDNL